MKKTYLILFSFLLVIATSDAAYGADDDDKLARYGQYGGPFSLVDHTGRTVTDRDFLGKYLLLFFGYTYCPDVCPTTMQVIGDALDLLGEEGRSIQPVFISVDPERDTVQELAGYVSNFHPRMVGLTGEKDKIISLADDYGATFFKVFLPPSIGNSDDQAEEPEKNQYLINHSAATYLMGPDGRFISYFPFGVGSEDIARKIHKILDK
ncbi:MAG: SCO family protein [Rhodospirillaceae bacterium]|jgi:cytochrome oxidase Cu insertion factor (SCO1/SenC/PrrC family)|nr:SCO family protein [Rhodospirillaceae bacterium]MBT5245102.1 SCO family protein [Rhodospirillaceae bacterium]MBT5562033.1 SCO family protein [Rhodospirillaceae bacterium]MBT6242206.1 SCO family protein [Rhodospirillaceae bacterium]MBT7136675.1 SCO family protein [Rhodospirillaceae bacterium]